jgi:hypothetical protein
MTNLKQLNLKPEIRMTKQIPGPNDAKTVVRFGWLIGAALLGCAACWWAAGFSLGLFFGGLFVTTVLLPAAVVEQPSFRGSITGFLAVVGIVSASWILAVVRTADTIGQILQTLVVLACYGLAVAGTSLALQRMFAPSIYAAAIAIIVGLAWLSWPVWLAPALSRRGMDGVIRSLVAIHPPLLVNGILTAEPAWTERSIAYHLTILNQDVPIELPRNCGVCAVVHGIPGAVLWGVAFVRRRVLQTPPSRLE